MRVRNIKNYQFLKLNQIYDSRIDGDRIIISDKFSDYEIDMHMKEFNEYFEIVVGEESNKEETDESI